MHKRIAAIVLAVLMLFACATTAFAAETTYKISSVKDLALLAQHPDADFELTCSIDLNNETWTPVGTAEKPFTGTLDGKGFEIENIKYADTAACGFFAYNAGTVKDLTLYNVQAAGSNVKIFGGFAAVNTGTISNCVLQVGAAKITPAANAQIGEIAGVNSGAIEKTISGVDLTVTSGETTAIGGLAAVNSGTITESNAAGRIIVTGSGTVGLIVNKAEETSEITDSRFTGSMALLNKELIKNMTVEKAGVMTGCLWRDNTSSLELITGEEREMRETILGYSHAMTSIVWTASKDLDMVEFNTDSANGRGHDKHYKEGETWYGMEYSHKFKGLAAFQYCFNDDGTFKDFVVDGGDGFDMYFTNDCSAATINCLQTCSPTLQSTGAGNSIPQYEINDTGLNNSYPVGYEVNPKTLTTKTTKKFYDYNGIETMVEAMAIAEPGDGFTSVDDGHSRLLTGSMILRDENGKIDRDESLIMLNGMGDGITRRIYHVDYEDDGLYTIAELAEQHWLPYTTKELIDGHKPAAEYKLTGVDRFDRAHLCAGKIETNYGILNVTMEILNKDGSTAFEKVFWERVYKWQANSGDDWSRRTIRTFNMSDFSTSLVGANLKEGNTYTVKISVLLTDLEEYEVKTYSFVY